MTVALLRAINEGAGKNSPKNQLLVPVHNPSAIQVVRTQLHGHAVAGQYPDEVLAHPSRDMGQHLVIILEFDFEHGVGQRLNDRCHYLNRIFFRQSVSSSAG